MSRPSPSPLKWVLIPLFCAVTGYTEKAIRRKIDSGAWAQGIHWRKAPDGHIMLNTEAFREWVENAA